MKRESTGESRERNQRETYKKVGSIALHRELRAFNCKDLEYNWLIHAMKKCV